MSAVHRVTMQDVAERAGVSRALVSRAFRGETGVSRDARAAIAAATEVLGYRHNAIAARLAAHHTKTIGLFLLDIYNEVFADIFAGMRAAAREAQYDIVLAVGGTRPDDEIRAVESLLHMRVDAAILAGSMLPDDTLRQYGAATTLVSTTRIVPAIDSIAAADRRGAQRATEHLLALGHRRIMFLAPSTGALYGEREQGYRAGMRSAGLQALAVATGLSRDTVAHTAHGILTSGEPPTAVFAYNDLTAFGVLQAAASLGLTVPGDLSLVGYDDTQPAALPGIRLTSVNQHATRQGRLAVARALAHIEKPDLDVQHKRLVPTLMIRESTDIPRERH